MQAVVNDFIVRVEAGQAFKRSVIRALKSMSTVPALASEFQQALSRAVEAFARSIGDLGDADAFADLCAIAPGYAEAVLGEDWADVVVEGREIIENFFEYYRDDCDDPDEVTTAAETISGIQDFYGFERDDAYDILIEAAESLPHEGDPDDHEYGGGGGRPADDSESAIESMFESLRNSAGR